MFEFNLAFESRAMKISKSMIDTDVFSFVHDDKTMKNEIIFDTDILQKFKQKRRRKNRNDEQTSIQQR